MNLEAFKEFRKAMKWWDNFNLELYLKIKEARK